LGHNININECDQTCHSVHTSEEKPSSYSWLEVIFSQGDRIQIDPLLLFQMLTAVMQLSDDLESVFKPEFCSYPSVLFDSSLLLREANKPAVADAICKTYECEAPADFSEDGIQCVLDGGALLQSIPWSHSSTYGDICNHYTEFHGPTVLHMETSATTTQNSMVPQFYI